MKKIPKGYKLITKGEVFLGDWLVNKKYKASEPANLLIGYSIRFCKSDGWEVYRKPKANYPEISKYIVLKKERKS